VTIECTPLERFPETVYARLAGDSFFASRGFLELWRTRGGTPVVWSIHDAGAVAGILPGVEFGVGPLTRFTSMPDGCYGGAGWDPAVARERGRLAATLLDHLSRRYARIHLFDLRNSLPAHGAFARPRIETRLVNIEAADWEPADAGLRAQIRKAARERLRIEAFRAEAHMDRFLALSAATYRRRGLRLRYDRRFFDALAALASRDPRVAWRWCEYHGRAVCSHIYFIEGDMLQSWQSYFDKSFSALKPNPAIRFAACRELAARGVRWLNLGSTPPGADGLLYYKERWGGNRIEVPALVRVRGLGRLAEAWRAARLGRRPPVAPSPRGLTAGRPSGLAQAGTRGR